jgi:hypothetical protein
MKMINHAPVPRTLPVPALFSIFSHQLEDLETEISYKKIGR